MKHLLMTGSENCLGEGIATTFLEEGWQVLALGNQPSPPLRAHRQFHFSPLDFSLRPQYPEALSRLLHLGQPDLVLLNAGVLLPQQAIASLSLDDLDRSFQTNLWAHRLILDILLQQTPGIAQVIALNSRSLSNGHHGWGSYALSKSGLNMLMRLYAVEHPEVHFCALAPGQLNQANPAALAGDPALEPATLGRRILQLLPFLQTTPSGSFLELDQLAPG